MKKRRKPVNYRDIGVAASDRIEDSGLIHEVGAFEAKTHLSAILENVANGHTYLVTRHGKMIAEIRPIIPQPKKRVLGFWKGAFKIADDFDAPLEDFKDYM